MELKDVKDVIDIVPTIYEDGAKPMVQETGKRYHLSLEQLMPRWLR